MSLKTQNQITHTVSGNELAENQAEHLVPGSRNLNV